MKPLLSIIIPTKNRQEYCKKSILHILSVESQEIHLVIKDNSDNEELRDFCNNINDPRLEYHYSNANLYISDNFESALEYIKGEYFLFLGDDDSINPNIIEFLSFFNKKQADAVVYKFPMYYVYPNSLLKTNGNLNFYVPTGNIEMVNNTDTIKYLLNKGLQEYNYTSLPRTYHGIIKTKVLLKIKDAGLKLFGGVSPDIYSAIILAHFTKNSYSIDYPLSIAGACPQSGSSMGTNKTHCGRLEDAIHFKGREITWSESLPRFYSVETIWAYAGIQAFEDLGKSIDLEKFNVYRMTARAIFNNRSIFKLIVSEFDTLSNKNIMERLKLYFCIFFEAGIFYSSKMKRKIKYIFLRQISITDGVQSFEEAVDIFEKTVSTKDILLKIQNEKF